MPPMAKQSLLDIKSSRWTLAAHNCACKKVSKTGIVLYMGEVNGQPNKVLLVCENCYGYKPGQTQHQQLYNWYQSVHADETHFAVSGFALTADGEIKINSTTFSAAGGTYHDDNRVLSPWELTELENLINE